MLSHRARARAARAAAVAGSISRLTTRSSSSRPARVVRRRGLELAPHPRGGDPEHLGAQVAGAALGQRARGSMCSRCASIVVEQLVDPLPLRGLGPDRSAPSSRGRGPSASTPRTSRTIVSVSGWSALLTTITSGISITPAFSAWIESPEPGISASTIVSAWSTMSISRLADADGLEQDVVLARGVHQQRRLQRRLGEAAERAAGRHRADEDARVEEVLGEADPVAEQGALGERARGVDREHRRPRGRALRSSAVSAPIRVLLPTPGGPVKPTIRALPVRGKTSRDELLSPPGRRSRPGVIARASARLSPATRRSASESASVFGARPSRPV